MAVLSTAYSIFTPRQLSNGCFTFSHPNPSPKIQGSFAKKIPFLVVLNIAFPAMKGELPVVGVMLEGELWLWVKTSGIPFWGRCTTHFSLF